MRKANEVYIDFESFKKAKVNLQVTSTVKSTLRENCEKRGLPKKMIEQIAPTEISMRAIKQAVKKNRSVRKEMQNTFKKPGDTGHDIYNVRDAIFDQTVQNVNEQNVEIL